MMIELWDQNLNHLSQPTDISSLSVHPPRLHNPCNITTIRPPVLARWNRCKYVLMDAPQSYGKIWRTREVGLQVSERCQDRREMRFAEAKNFTQAVQLARQMIEDYHL